MEIIPADKTDECGVIPPSEEIGEKGVNGVLKKSH